MRSLSISSSDIVRLLKRAAGFAAGLAVVCPIVLFALSRIPAPDGNDYARRYSLYQFITRDYTLPGGYGYTLTRFRDIEQCRDIDILFLGSSRCYYSFAPHVFQRLDLTTFNMGSPSQTPLNTRYLLDHYCERLNPKLVVAEVNLHILEKDGVESFFDLMINTPPSWDNFRMSLATRHPHAITGLLVHALSCLSGSFDDVRMQDRPMDPYLGAGAMEARNFNEEFFAETSAAVQVPGRQLEYLRDLIDFVKGRGCRMILVVAPIPREWRSVIVNYEDVTAEIRSLAAAHGVRLYDFNQAMTLNSRKDFKDFHHLNANGAKIFSYDILDSLLDVPEYRQVLNIKPELAAEVYNGRGITFAQQGDLDRAIDDYHRALALAPHSGIIYYNQARACQQAGRTAEAIEAYRNFVRFAPPEYAQHVEPVKAQIEALRASQLTDTQTGTLQQAPAPQTTLSSAD